MKATSAGMDAALADATVYLARCYYVLRSDGTGYRFTDHDQSLVIAGLAGAEAVLNGTYLAASSPTPSALEADMDVGVDTMEVSGPLVVGAVDPDDIDAGLFNGADVWIFVVNWDDLTDGIVRLRRGTLGEISRMDVGYRFEVRGLTQALLQEPVALYTADCRFDLGDGTPGSAVGCLVQIEPAAWAATTAYVARVAGDAATEMVSPGSIVQPSVQNFRSFLCTTAGTSGGAEPAWNTTIGGTTADGSVVWTAIQSRVVTQVVSSVVDRREFVGTAADDAPDAYYGLGHVRCTSGANAGLTRAIKSWVQSTTTIRTFLAFPYAIAPADVFDIFAGCDKTRATCRDAFDNIRNFGGFPDLPGPDDAFRSVLADDVSA